MKLVLIALVLALNPLHALTPNAPECTEHMTNARVVALTNLLNKALDDGAIETSDLQNMVSAKILRDPLAGAAATARNAALKTAFAKLFALTGPEARDAVLKRLPAIVARRLQHQEIVEDARAKTAAVADAQATFSTQWPHENPIFKSQLHWFRDSRGNDRLAALNPDHLQIRIFDPLGASAPLFDQMLMDDKDVIIPLIMNSSAGPQPGRFKLAFWSATEKALKLFTYDGDGRTVATALDEIPLALRVQETAAGRVYIVAAFTDSIRIYAATGPGLVQVSEVKAELPDKITTFLSARDELMVHARVGGDLVLFKPLAQPLPLETWPVGDRVYPFVTKAGELVAVAAVQTDGRHDRLAFYRQGENYVREGRFHWLPNDAAVAWHEGTDGQLQIAIKGTIDAKGDWSSRGYSLFKPFATGSFSPPATITTPTNPYSARWLDTPAGLRLLIFEADVLHVYDENWREVQAPFEHHDLATAKPGPLAAADGTVYLAGAGVQDFWMLNTQQTQPLLEVRGGGTYNLTEWHTMVDGDVVTAAAFTPFHQEKIQVYRLLKGAVAN